MNGPDGTDVMVTWREVYGQDLAYPASPMARLLCDMAGTKTMTHWMLRMAKSYDLKIHGWEA